MKERFEKSLVRQMLLGRRNPYHHLERDLFPHMELDLCNRLGRILYPHASRSRFPRSDRSWYLRLCRSLCLLILCCTLTMGPCGTVLAASDDNPYEVEVGHYGMTPIYGRDVEDGSYIISVDSTSHFFKIVEGTLTVDGDRMTGSIEIQSHSYLYIYLGTREEAAAASEADYIYPEEKGDSYVYTFELEALDKPINCAAYSKRKKKWYDRRILFDATTLPEGALKIDLPDYEAIEAGLEKLQEASGSLASETGSGGNVGTGNNAGSGSNAGTGNNAGSGSNAGTGNSAGTGNNTGTGGSGGIYGSAIGDAYTPAEAVSVNLEDGEYSIDVSMTGGTGRATISSPTYMIVKDGKAYAKLLMSSSHYDWMIAAGITYQNENSDGGNSIFTIPITAMDTLINIIADTTAMGNPVAIEYTLTFYEETIGNKGQIPQEAAKKVLIVAFFIIVVGGILNHFAKRNRRKGKKGRGKRR